MLSVSLPDCGRGRLGLEKQLAKRDTLELSVLEIQGTELVAHLAPFVPLKEGVFPKE